MHIPWGHLGSKPVRVFLEGVCVLVGPVDKDSWGDDEVTARRLGIKRAWLDKQEKAALKKEKEAKKDEDDSKKVHCAGGHRISSFLLVLVCCSIFARFLQPRFLKAPFP